MKANWQCFWNEQIDPLHNRSSNDFYLSYGRELTLLFIGQKRRVLEIGCGDGALFVPLGFDRSDYTGVDFSTSMLGEFERKHPGRRLIAMSGDEYVDDGGYDLIFCNGLIQYFDKAMLTRFLSNASQMLAPYGYIVLGSIPWQALRWGYYTGELRRQPRSLWRGVRALCSDLTRHSMGRWYSFSEIKRLSESQQLSAELFGSLHFPYRFHVRLTPYAKR